MLNQDELYPEEQTPLLFRLCKDCNKRFFYFETQPNKYCSDCLLKRIKNQIELNGKEKQHFD